VSHYNLTPVLAALGTVFACAALNLAPIGSFIGIVVWWMARSYMLRMYTEELRKQIRQKAQVHGDPNPVKDY
jgi:hypothetical protein